MTEMEIKRFLRVWVKVGIVFVMLGGVGPVVGQSLDSPPERVIDRFSEKTGPDGLPSGWEPLTFKKVPNHTLYTLQESSGNFYLKADSRASASGLIKRIEINPRTYPILSWRWKIEGVVPSGDVRRKDRDDYAARIYVNFAFDPETAGLWERVQYGTYKTLHGEYPPKASLNYIWAAGLEKGGSIASPYSRRSMMIAVESGAAAVGRWRTEERNVLQDYRDLFGEEPPMIQGIAIMTDTDNTGESAVAYYDDIVFRSLPSHP